MAGRSIALAIASGVATFLFVAGLVSALTHQWGGFGILAGLVLGSIAGAVATAGVTAALTGDVPHRQRRLVGGFAGFMVGFVATLVVVTRLFVVGEIGVLSAGVIAGLVLGIWGSQQGETLQLESES